MQGALVVPSIHPLLVNDQNRPSNVPLTTQSSLCDKLKDVVDCRGPAGASTHLLFCIVLFLVFWWRSFTVPGTKVAPFPKLMWGVAVHCLRNISFSSRTVLACGACERPDRRHCPDSCTLF
jgi:hypothetical protein